jgi:geranylgeranyl pyrophosphate synthase
MVADLPECEVGRIGRMMIPLGIAFQIQDDILNVSAEEATYGKDLLADLWEGKHTLILMHALGAATPAERELAVAILKKPQPSGWEAPVEPAEHSIRAGDPDGALLKLIDRLANQGELSARARAQLKHALGRGRPNAGSSAKTAEEIEFLRQLIMKYDSIAYAGRIGRRYALRFQREIRRLAESWPRSPHKAFLMLLARFTVDRRL